MCPVDDQRLSKLESRCVQVLLNYAKESKLISHYCHATRVQEKERAR